MAATVAVVQTSAAGIGVAVDVVGTSAFQQVKLIGGAVGVTLPIEATTATPAGAALGMVVRQIEPVSGTVSVSGTVPVSGTLTITPTVLTVNTAPTVAGASVTAQVSGTVSISPTILTVNTAATIAGASVTIQQGASVVAQASGTLTITPTVLTVNTAATVAGASITIQQGASVSAVVSGTITVSGLVGHSVTGSVNIVSTAIVSLATGGTIATLLGTLPVTGSVNILSTAVVSLATGGTIATLLGTLPVTGTIQNVASISTILNPVSIVRNAGMVIVTVTNTSVLITSTAQLCLMTVPFDAYTSAVLVSGYSIRAPFQVTGITMIYSATSVTASSMVIALYATTSGVSLTTNAIPIWTTVFPTMTGAAVSTQLVFPYTVLLPANGVVGIAAYRSSSATTAINVAFTMIGQYSAP